MKILVRRRHFHWLGVGLFVAAMVMTPWPQIVEQVYGRGFIDRGVYTGTILSGEGYASYAEFSGPVSYVTNEYLWHALGLIWTKTLGLDVEYLFLSISVMCLVVFGGVLVRAAGPVALVLLINPLVVDFAFSQLRLALAASLLGFALLVSERRWIWRMVFAGLSLLVHTASVILVIVYFGTRLVERLSFRFKGGHWIQLVGLLLIGGLISLAIGPLRELLLSAVGDRRATYADMSSSVAYSLYWIVLLAAIACQARSALQHQHNQFSVVALAIVVVNLLHGGYSTRILAVFFPFLVASVVGLRGLLGATIAFLFVLYAVLQWMFWLRLV